MKQSINHLTAEMQYAFLKDESESQREKHETLVSVLVGLAMTPVIFGFGYAMLRALYFIRHDSIAAVFG